jgi:hypothetical protein
VALWRCRETLEATSAAEEEVDSVACRAMRRRCRIDDHAADRIAHALLAFSVAMVSVLVVHGTMGAARPAPAFANFEMVLVHSTVQTHRPLGHYSRHVPLRIARARHCGSMRKTRPPVLSVK